MKENNYQNINDITYWGAVVNNLDHVALLILIAVVGIILSAIFIVWFSDWKLQGGNTVGKMGMLLSVIFTVISLVMILLGGASNLFDERRDAMNSNIHQKYDIDIADTGHASHYGKNWKVDTLLLSSNHNVNIGFDDDSIEESDVKYATVVFNENSEPKILPWEGVNVSDIEKMLRNTESAR